MKPIEFDIPDKFYVPTKADLKKVRKMWAGAFTNYPMYKWMIPEDETREKLLPYMMEALANFGAKYGNIVATSKKLEGVGIFLLPHQMPMSTWKWLRAGMLKLVFKWGFKRVKRMLHVSDFVEEIMEKTAPKPFAYLMFGAVRPDMQGMGLATDMLQTAITNLGEMGIASYGETFKKKNAMLYDYIGLKLVGEHPVPGTDLTLYAHLSQPKKSDE